MIVEKMRMTKTDAENHAALAALDPLLEALGYIAHSRCSLANTSVFYVREIDAPEHTQMWYSLDRFDDVEALSRWVAEQIRSGR